MAVQTVACRPALRAHSFLDSDIGTEREAAAAANVIGAEASPSATAALRFS